MNFRDFHIVTTDCKFDVRQEINQNKVKVVINGQSATPIYMNLTQGKYIKHDSDQFNNMYYIEEEKRGFEAEGYGGCKPAEIRRYSSCYRSWRRSRYYLLFEKGWQAV